MSLTAVVLLRIPACTPSPEEAVRVEALDDAVLLHTEARFGRDPEGLALLVQRSLGPAFDAHDDARGLFVLPSVAKPQARDYAGVIAELGAGGMWIDAPAQHDGDAFAAADGLGALGAVLGSMLQHMPQGLLDGAAAAARGDMDGLSQLSGQVASLLGHGDDGPVDMAALLRLASSSGLDLSSPMFQQLLGGLQAQLERDPAQMQRLAEQLFGQSTRPESDDD